MCAQRRLRSAWASAQSDQSSLCALWVAKDPRVLHADSEDSDPTGRMPRLIWVFAWRRLILLVLSCRGLYRKSEKQKFGQFEIVPESYSNNNINEPRHDKTNNVAVCPAKTQISLGIRPVWSVFAVRMKKAWVLSYPLSAQRRLWSDWADAQADRSLRWAHTHFDGFVMSRLKCNV